MTSSMDNAVQVKQRTDLEELYSRVENISNELNTSLMDLRSFLSRVTGIDTESATASDTPHAAPGHLARIMEALDVQNVTVVNIRKCISAIEKIG